LYGTTLRDGHWTNADVDSSAVAPRARASLHPRRVSIDHAESFVGFLRLPDVEPGECPTLDAFAEAAPPLRDIVASLAASARGGGGATFVVSWSDHFFLVRFVREPTRAGPPGWDRAMPPEMNAAAAAGEEAGEKDAADEEDADVVDTELVVYVVDSLGERLCEGCKRGYVLRFDGESGSGDAAEAAATFIGEILPSRLLAHLSAEVKGKDGGDVAPERLMRALQIEFHRVVPS